MTRSCGSDRRWPVIATTSFSQPRPDREARRRRARTSIARSSGCASTMSILIQLHSLGHPDDRDQAMGQRAGAGGSHPGAARETGPLHRVTGHRWSIPAMHRRSLARFDFDFVLLPYNFFMAQTSATGKTSRKCWRSAKRNVAVQVIKLIARGPWAATERTHTTWYQPLRRRRTSTGPSTGSSTCSLMCSSTPLKTSCSCPRFSTPRAASSGAHRHGDVGNAQLGAHDIAPRPSGLIKRRGR